MTDAPDLPVAPDPAGDDASDPMKMLGKSGLTGSKCPYFAQQLMNQLLPTLPSFGSRGRTENIVTAVSVLADIGPRSPIEGMLAAQMVAVHSAAMEAMGRANLAGQTFEARAMNLAQASKLTRSFATLVEALDRHRGKGQPQVVRVERVTVEAGGQAIVGAVSQGEGGVPQEMTNNPVQSSSPMHQSPRCGARTRSGSPCRSPAVKGKRRCRMHGGAEGSGAPRGNRNALQHGLRSAEVLMLQRQVRELLRGTRELIEKV